MRYTLRCDGQAWTGWKSFSVKQSMENAAHAFSFTTTDRFQEGLDRWNVKGGSKIEFFIDEDKILEGFVRKYKVSISEETHEISIDGDSAAIDIIECSHLGPYFWKAGPAEDVIKAVLGPYGFDLKIDKALKPIPKGGYRVGNNESPFEIVKKLLERDGLTLFTDRENKLVATDGRNAIDAGEIGRGDYIEIGADHDFSNNFSEIVVKAQSNDREPTDKEQFDKKQRQKKTVKKPIKKTPDKKRRGSSLSGADNAADTRYRPVVFVNSGEEDAQKELAEEIARRFSGDIITATVGLKSHKSKNGVLWGINQLVFLNEPLIQAKQKLLISEVEYSLSEDAGYRTNISLKPPPAFDKEADSKRANRLAGDGPFKETMEALLPALEALAQEEAGNGP